MNDMIRLMAAAYVRRLTSYQNPSNVSARTRLHFGLRPSMTAARADTLLGTGTPTPAQIPRFSWERRSILNARSPASFFDLARYYCEGNAGGYPEEVYVAIAS
jgi:hypothetical protein